MLDQGIFNNKSFEIIKKQLIKKNKKNEKILEYQKNLNEDELSPGTLKKI